MSDQDMPSKGNASCFQFANTRFYAKEPFLMGLEAIQKWRLFFTEEGGQSRGRGGGHQCFGGSAQNRDFAT